MASEEEDQAATDLENKKAGAALGGKNKNPTIAAVDRKHKSVKSALDEVDPQRLSEIFKNMHNEFNKISNMLSFSLPSGSSSSSTPTPTSSVSDILIDALTGALALLVREYGYERVVNFLVNILGDGKHLLLPDEYKIIVRQALIILIVAVVLYGESDIPVSELPEIVFGDNIPENLVTFVPDLYVQNFYSFENDPYPGYIEWEGPDGDLVYTIRGVDDLPYSSSEDYVYTLAERGLYEALKIYFENENIVISIVIFISLLYRFCKEIEENGMNVTVGKNGNKSTIDVTSLLGSVLGGMTNLAQNVHIPDSILDKTKLTQALNEFKQTQGRIKQVLKPSFIKAAKTDPSETINSVISSISSLQSLLNANFSPQQITNLASGISGNLGYLSRINNESINNINVSNTNTNNVVIENIILNVDSEIDKLLEILEESY